MIYRTVWAVDANQQFVISEGRSHICPTPSLREGRIIKQEVKIAVTLTLNRN